MTSPDDVQVKINFRIEQDGYPPYGDALYVPLDDYPNLLASGELERLKTERWERWRDSIDNPPVEEETPEAAPESAALAQARQALNDALAALDAAAPAPAEEDVE